METRRSPGCSEGQEGRRPAPTGGAAAASHGLDAPGLPKCYLTPLGARAGVGRHAAGSSPLSPLGAASWVPDSPPPSSSARQGHGQGRADPRGPRRGARSFRGAQKTLGDNLRANKRKTWTGPGGEPVNRGDLLLFLSPKRRRLILPSSRKPGGGGGGRSSSRSFWFPWRPQQRASAFTNQSSLALEGKGAEPILPSSGVGAGESGAPLPCSQLLSPEAERGRRVPQFQPPARGCRRWGERRVREPGVRPGLGRGGWGLPQEIPSRVGASTLRRKTNQKTKKQQRRKPPKSPQPCGGPGYNACFNCLRWKLSSIGPFW